MEIKQNIAWQVCQYDNLRSAIVELRGLGWRFVGTGNGRYYFDRVTANGLQVLEVVKK